MTLKRVVVTGIGSISPVGANAEETWKNVVNGVCGIDLITHYDTTNFKTKFACEVKNYDPLQYFDRKELRRIDKFTQFAIIASDEAIKDSAIDFESMDKSRAGVIWSSGIGGVETFLEEIKGFIEGNYIPRFSPFFHSENYFRYCSRTYINETWTYGSKLLYCVSLCFFVKCYYRFL